MPSFSLLLMDMMQHQCRCAPLAVLLFKVFEVSCAEMGERSGLCPPVGDAGVPAETDAAERGPCSHTAPRGPDGEVPRTDRHASQGLVQLKAHPRGTQGQGKGTVRSKAGETRQGRSPCPLLPRAALPALSTPPAEPAVCGNPGAKDAPKKFPVFAGFAGASGKNTARGV